MPVINWTTSLAVLSFARNASTVAIHFRAGAVFQKEFRYQQNCIDGNAHQSPFNLMS